MAGATSWERGLSLAMELEAYERWEGDTVEFESIAVQLELRTKLPPAGILGAGQTRTFRNAAQPAARRQHV